MYRYTFLFLVLVCLPCQGYSEVPLGVKKAVVRLLSEKGCGTGFFLEGGRLITNVHVVDGICLFGDCSEVILENGSGGKWEFVEVAEIEVERLHRAFDLAVLTVSPAPESYLELAEESASLGSEVQIYGHPDCELPESSRGTITQQDSIFIHTSAKGLPGNSGSPLLNTHYQVVGLISTLSSDLSSLLSASFNLKTRMNGYGVEVLQLVEEETRQEALSRTVSLLDSYVASEFRDTFSNSSALSIALDGLAHELLADFPDSDATKILTLWQLRGFSGLDALREVEWTEFLEAVERLGLSFNLAMMGKRDIGGMEEVDTTSVSDLIKASARSNYHQERFIERMLGFEGPGLIILLLFYVGLGGALLSIWSWSLGVVFCRVRGSMLTRWLKALSIGVLFWPFSLLVFWVVRKISRKPA